jgi:hypothetical protein
VVKEVGEIADPERIQSAQAIIFMENTFTLAKKTKVSEHEAYS